MAVIGFAITIITIKELFKKSHTSLPAKQNPSTKLLFIVSSELLNESLRMIQQSRIALTEQMLSKKQFVKSDKKKLTKKSKRKRSEADNSQVETKSEFVQAVDKKSGVTGKADANEAEKKEVPVKKNTEVEASSGQQKKHKLKDAKSSLSKPKPEESITVKASKQLDEVLKPKSDKLEINLKSDKPSEEKSDKIKSSDPSSSDPNSSIKEIMPIPEVKSNTTEVLSTPLKEPPASNTNVVAEIQPNVDSDSKPYYMKAKNVDYRDQYHYPSAGKYFKRTNTKYAYKQPRYQKRYNYPSSKLQQPVDHKNFANKSFTEDIKEDDNGFNSAKKLNAPGLTKPIAAVDNPVQEHLHKPRTNSLMSEESVKRRGLGGILLREDSPIEEFAAHATDTNKKTESEIVEEESEQDFYNCYNPLNNFDLKLPEPFRTGKEEEKEEDNKAEISLYEAYRSANSLLGNRSFMVKPCKVAEDEKFISPLSELRDDSVEYIPKLQRRFVPKENSDH